MRGATAAGGGVLIVEDDDDVRALLVVTLQGSGFETFAAPSGEIALQIARGERPRVAIVDVHLPGISGYEVCRALRDSNGDEIGIVIVSGERIESFDRVAGLLLGADDYVVKPFATDELLVRIRRLSRRLTPSARVVATRLTTREREVLRLLAIGMSRDEMAAHMFISPKTVATHTEHIFLKLGVQSRAQATALAYREALIPGSPASPAPATSAAMPQRPSTPVKLAVVTADGELEEAQPADGPSRFLAGGIRPVASISS